VIGVEQEAPDALLTVGLVARRSGWPRKHCGTPIALDCCGRFVSTAEPGTGCGTGTSPSPSRR